MKSYLRVYHYKTTRLAELIPGIRSSLLFNGVNYQGDGCKSKKEADQLVASAVISKPWVELCSQGHYYCGTLTEAQIAATTPAAPVVT
ncbi:hypothetical protein Tco_1146886 [Tanacetum coccineum]